MAGTKYGSFAVGDANIDNVMLNLAGINTGYCALTLTEMTTTNVPQIAAGSKIEVGGSLFKFDANETITGSATTGTNYIRLVPSGSSITAEWATTAPTWSDSKQGWYDGTGAYRYAPFRIIYASPYYKKITFDIFNKGPAGVIWGSPVFLASGSGATTGEYAITSIQTETGLSEPAKITDTFGVNQTTYLLIPYTGLYVVATSGYTVSGNPTELKWRLGTSLTGGVVAFVDLAAAQYPSNSAIRCAYFTAGDKLYPSVQGLTSFSASGNIQIHRIA